MSAIVRNDIVIVITGRDKGKEGRVLRVLPKHDQLLVEGVNKKFKHLRKSNENPRGARIEKEAPIHSSNVMLKDPKTGKPTRVRFIIPKDAKGKRSRERVRVSVRSGEVLPKNVKK